MLQNLHLYLIPLWMYVIWLTKDDFVLNLLSQIEHPCDLFFTWIVTIWGLVFHLIFFDTLTLASESIIEWTLSVFSLWILISFPFWMWFWTLMFLLFLNDGWLAVSISWVWVSILNSNGPANSLRTIWLELDCALFSFWIRVHFKYFFRMSCFW